jgi:CheY-like chemotaxis protein
MLPHLLTKADPAVSQTDFVKAYAGTLAPWRLPAGVNRRVLFMDDDEEIRLLTSGMLAGLGYDFDLAVRGEDVLELYRRQLAQGNRYHAVIMDLTIKQGLGGAQTMVHLQKIDPTVCAIITSGYNSEEFEEQISEMGFSGILSKPYNAADVGRLLSTVLGG